jgi:hypothetical protein
MWSQPLLILRASAFETNKASDPNASEASMPTQEIASEATLASEAIASEGKIQPKPLEEKFSKVVEVLLDFATSSVDPEPTKEKRHGKGIATSEEVHPTSPKPQNLMHDSIKAG